MGINSDNNFRDFFKNNIDFLFILDMEGNIIETNNAVHNILGYSDEDIIGKSVLEVHPPEYREKALDTVKKMLTGEVSFCQIPLQTKNKEYISVETTVFSGEWDYKPALIGVSRNLTDLKLSEEKFFKVFDKSHVLMAVSTLDTGVYVNVNQEVSDTLGYTKEELIGKASKDLDIFFDYKQRLRAFELYEKKGQLKNYQIYIKTKSGELRECLFSVDKIKIQTHEYFLTSAQDVTELKKAELKVRYLFKQQKLLADISQLLNTTNNLESVLDDVLNFIGEHTDVSRVYILENIKNETAGKVTHEWCNTGIEPLKMDNRERVYEKIPSWKKMLINEGCVHSNNIENLPEDIYQTLKPQGVKTVIVYPLYMQGVFYGSIGFHECISDQAWSTEEIDLLKTVSNNISNALERKHVLDKLKSSELTLQLALRGANEGLWDLNLETGQLFLSDILQKILGYEPNELDPSFSNWLERIHPDYRSSTMELINKHLRGETEFYEATYRIKTKDGNWKWVLDRGMVVQRDANSTPVRAIGTNIDVTEQKETEQQLIKSINTQNKLFSIIAHDLRGPIGNVLPIIDLLTNGEELDEFTKNIFMEELKKSTQNTFDLLENLLSWSRSQMGAIVLKPVPFKVYDIVKDNVDLLASSASQKMITVIENVDENLYALADINTTKVVIRNLISNAIKFTPKNGAITITAFNNGSQIEVEIADNGVGMDKELTNNLFTFYQYNTTYGTNNEKGSGLGLVLCKDFVERNGGQIRVESIKEEGSKFIFTIPLVKNIKAKPMFVATVHKNS